MYVVCVCVCVFALFRPPLRLRILEILRFRLKSNSNRLTFDKICFPKVRTGCSFVLTEYEPVASRGDPFSNSFSNCSFCQTLSHGNTLHSLYSPYQ